MVKCDNTRKKYILYDYEAEQSTTRSLQFATILIAVLLLAVVVVPHFMDVRPVKAAPGDIGSTIDSWSDDGGSYIINRDSIVKLGDSNYYATVSSNYTTGDGFLKVFEVYDNGTITDSLVDEWEFDETNGMAAGIKHLTGDTYIVYYCDTSNGAMFTTTIWSSNGTCKEDRISNITYSTPHNNHLIHVSGDIYALSYLEGAASRDHFLETYNIWGGNGTISSRIDVVEYDETNTLAGYEYLPHIELVDSDTIAVVYGTNDGANSNGRLVTYNISSEGDITDTYADYWAFNTSKGYFPCIEKISGNVFAISFIDGDDDGWIKTLTIADTGAITKSFTDTLEFAPVLCSYNQIFTVDDAAVFGDGVYGVVYRSSDNDGWLCTMNISSDGTMDDNIIESFEFDDSNSYYIAKVIHLSENNYTVFYADDNYYDSLVTFDIETTEESVPSSFSLDGLTDDKITWYGLRGESVWCNSSGTGYETLQIQITCNTSVNVTNINVYLMNMSYSGNYLSASNVTMYVSSNNSNYGSLGAFVNGGSNISINASTWNAGTMGANPFPIAASTSDIIYVRFLLAIPNGVSPPDGTYVSTGFKVYLSGYS